MTTLAEALATAFQHHQAGRAAQAEQIYRQILQADPHHAEAYHLLGMLLHATGQHAQAFEHLRRALTYDPLNAIYLNNLALVHQSLGRPDEAAACYRRALRLSPASPEIHYNLGNTLRELGRLDEAVAAYRQAVRLRPESPDLHNSLGTALRQQGKLDEAVAEHEEALRLRPGHPAALNNLGVALQQQGRRDEAVARYHEAIRHEPGHPEAHSNLGAALREAGDLDEAVTHYQEALRLRPDYAEAHYNLGNVLIDLERPDEAAEHFQTALRLRPGQAEVHNSLGNARRRQGRLEEAMACYRQAIQVQPDYGEAYANLGTAFLEQGKPEEAAACLERALQTRPDEAALHATLAGVDAERGRTAEAVVHYEQALRLDADNADTHAHLGDNLNQLGRTDEAATHLREAVRLRPCSPFRFQHATLLPPLYRSLDDLHAWRRRFADNLRQLHEEGVRIDLNKETAAPVFYLAYQGMNDRDLQRDLARLCVPPDAAALPEAAAAGTRGKIKVGFLSRCLRDHTIGHLNRGVIAGLSRDDFEVSVLAVGRHQDATSQFLRQHADAYVELPGNVHAARRAVAALGLDVLYFTDIGMEPATYTLAFARLAPVQCVTWGHPLTTGIDTMDYFISSELLEVEEAGEHYTEKLARLKDLSVYYYRPGAPDPAKGRAHFGLPEDAHLYGCPQSLFKFHPEFDAVLADILRRDPRGLLVLLENRNRHWVEILMRRLTAVLPDAAERVRFVPPQGRADFLALNAAFDVLLDPLHFGGGNTSYEALALGVPIVTLPSRFLRGRITQALYRKMGVLDCVASDNEDYVARAVRLACDADYRRAVRAKILEANGVLYEDAGAVRGLEEFFRQAVASSGEG